MKNPQTSKDISFKIYAALSLITAIYHLTGIFFKIDNANPSRHIVFLIISLLCIYGFLKRPKLYIYFFVAISIQQYYSHGSYFLNLWNTKREIHWISLAIFILLPIATWLLISDKRKRNTTQLHEE